MQHQDQIELVQAVQALTRKYGYDNVQSSLDFVHYMDKASPNSIG